MITDFKIQELENQLVRLVPLIGIDFEKIYKVASDPSIWEQHPASDRYQKEKFESYFNNAPCKQWAYVALDRQTGEVIGSTRYYDYKPAEKSLAIGYTFLAREYWGGAYNQSIKTALLDYAFQAVDRVYFHIAPANIRSQKATNKIGAQKVGDYHLEFNGQKLLHFEYAIEKEDWGLRSE
ncbi:hypothetical protein CLV98_11924 [Dyadobacter jejuensis]|uniref:N-acetyltransferase domain-containing protein n=1 Tax=Dyadobacter jejuensis TaxID=1082580 RepID=A0A316A8H4_9BACT|nr:GNAT family N-acetyltransferase [Dyadobacter jejuensis]PWJ54081.1 hypothetical protein CLV98_11924 [Dyadobacter jejuensis]